MTGGQVSVLLPLATAWALVVMLPGPNFLVIVWTASSRGRGAALATAAGVLTGAAFWVAAGLFGLNALFTLLPFAGTVIKLVGAGYLIWFGLRMLVVAGADGSPAGRGVRGAYRAGLATTLANPKSAAVAASLLAVALPSNAPGWFAAETFVLLIGISAAWYVTVAIVGSLPAIVRLFLRARRGLTRAAGAVFVVFGTRLAMER